MSKIPTYGIYNPSVNILKNGGFGSVFAAARKAGKKDFIWRGRRYSTQIQEKVKQEVKQVKSVSNKILNKIDSTKKKTLASPQIRRKTKQIVNNLENSIPVTNIFRTDSSPAQYLPQQPQQERSYLDIVGDSNININMLNSKPTTYYYKPLRTQEGEMWGVGSYANPVKLSEIVVTAPKPGRETVNILDMSQKNKLGKEYQGDYCAKWRNDQLRKEGYEIYGHAWTTPNFADKVYSGFDTLKRPKNPSKQELEDYSAAAAENFAQNFTLDALDPSQTYVVGTTYKGSPNKKLAFEDGIKGEANTHTGYAKYENGKWMFHSNVHGTEYVSPMQQMLGDQATMAITSIYKPRKVKAYGGSLNLFNDGGSLNLFGEGGDTHLIDNPNGVDMSNLRIQRNGNISYANSDTKRIKNALSYVEMASPNLMNQYNLSLNAYRDLIPLEHAILYKESNGGYPTYMSQGQPKDNSTYYTLHHTLNVLRNMKNDPSQGLGSVKKSTLEGNLPYVYNGDYYTEGNEFSGISTFAAVATNYNKLKNIFGENNPLVFNLDGTLNNLGQNLILTAHNQGWDNIIKNYSNYNQTGNLAELLQYNNFSYPKVARQVIDGHSYHRPKTLLPELIVTPEGANYKKTIK